MVSQVWGWAEEFFAFQTLMSLQIKFISEVLLIVPWLRFVENLATFEAFVKVYLLLRLMPMLIVLSKFVLFFIHKWTIETRPAFDDLLRFFIHFVVWITFYVLMAGLTFLLTLRNLFRHILLFFLSYLIGRFLFLITLKFILFT